MSIDPSSQLIPDMLDWVEIRWVGRPIQSPDVELSDKFINNASTVGSGVVILKDSPLIHPTVKRNNDRLKNVVHRPLGIEISINNTKPSFWFIVTPAQTTTKPPPNRSYSLTVASENLSPWRLYTLVLPLLKFRLNRLSLEKSTLDHCCLVHWMCWWQRPRRARLWRCVNVVRTAGRLDLRFPALNRFRTVWSKMFTPVEVLSWCYNALAVIRRFLWVMLRM